MTDEFDYSLFPEGARYQPGPLTLRSEPPRIKPVRQSTAEKSGALSGAGATAVVTYLNHITGVAKPLAGAKIVVEWYDGYED